MSLRIVRGSRCFFVRVNMRFSCQNESGMKNQLEVCLVKRLFRWSAHGRTPTLVVRTYRHSKTHRYYLDLRPVGQGRKFFKTRSEEDTERLRQITLRERGGREAVGLPLNELSDIVEARRKLAAHGKTLKHAAAFFLDHLERIR